MSGGPARALVDEMLPAWAGRSADSPFDLLRRLATLADDQVVRLAFAHPRLLRPDTLALLRAEVRSAPERAALAALERCRQLIEEDSRAYLTGLGPVERLWQHVEAGALRFADAEELAGDPWVAGQLFDIYIRALGRWTVGAAHEHGAWQRSLGQARVLYAAAQASPEDGRAENVSLAGVAYVECAKVALCEEPDGRLYRRAVDVAQTVVEARRGMGTEALARGLCLLGRLKLDPCTAELMPFGCREQFARRFTRAHFHPTVEAAGADLDMPAPADALREASDHLRVALELGAGPDQPMTAKALVQALWYRYHVVGDVDRAEVEDAARTALEVISPERDPDRWSFVEFVLRGGTDECPGRLPAPVDELVVHYGRPRTLQLALTATAACEDPAGVLAIVDEVRPVAVEHGDPELYNLLLTAEYHVIGEGLAPDVTDGDGPPDRRLRQLHRRARRLRWTEEQLQAAQVRLAFRTQYENLEEQGLRLLTEVATSSSVFARERADAIGGLAVNLMFGQARNLGAARRFLPAMEWYADALGCYVDAGLRDMALLCVHRMAGMAEGDSTLSAYLLAHLALHALPLEAAFGPAATEALQDVYSHASADLADPTTYPEVAILLHQLAKGLGFATAAATPGALDLAGEDELLDHVRTAEQEADELAENTSLAEEELLTAYGREQEAGPGDRLANLQRTFDRRLVQRLHDERTDASGVLFTEPFLRGLLDDRTVFVSLYLGGTPAAPAVHAVAVTERETRTTVTPYPTDSLACYVAGLRGGAAERALATDPPRFFRDVAARLARWRAEGRDHLCVWPHGPLHYLPFHLFHTGGRPLAEDWVVTTLPAASLLGVREPRREGPPRLLSVGCAGTGPASVPELPAQATAVASVLGGTLLTGDDATPERFLAELPRATHVHIATQGAHNVHAPAFQCLYLRGGRVFAHDLLRHDLSNVELVTLSACQTALGRFDVGDNLRGLPAALLQAGCRTIIATLWPVGPAAASTFFTTLYGCLGAGQGRRDAFHVAQTRTRERHPHHCDWGAYTFVGAPG